MIHSKLIQCIAEKHGVPAEEVIQEIQEAIDMAWKSDDPNIRRRQNALFPDGKPNVILFIAKLANIIINE